MLLKQKSLVAPRIAPFIVADAAVNTGDSISVVCTVTSGDTPLEFSWALNNLPITNQRDVSIMNNKRSSLLSIDSVTQRHGGTYSCVASNAAGSTSYSADLMVNGTETRKNKKIFRSPQLA